MRNPPFSAGDTTTAARDTFNAVETFLYVRNYLKNNTIMFGETWSNSGETCNGYNDVTLTQLMITAYPQSCLFSASNSGCQPTLPGDTALPANVVFRPWGQDEYNGATCETPLHIGAPGGPFKQ